MKKFVYTWSKDKKRKFLIKRQNNKKGNYYYVEF